MPTKVKSKRGKVFKPKGFEPSPYEVDTKRHGFVLKSPKNVEITDEMCARVADAVGSCSDGVLNAHVNDKKHLIVVFRTIRPSSKTASKLAELISLICRTVANTMLNESKAAKKRFRAAQATKKSSHKRGAREASYLNRSRSKTPVTP